MTNEADKRPDDSDRDIDQAMRFALCVLLVALIMLTAFAAIFRFGSVPDGKAELPGAQMHARQIGEGRRLPR